MNWHGSLRNDYQLVRQVFSILFYKSTLLLFRHLNTEQNTARKFLRAHSLIYIRLLRISELRHWINSHCRGPPWRRSQSSRSAVASCYTLFRSSPSSMVSSCVAAWQTRRISIVRRPWHQLDVIGGSSQW